MINLFRSKSVNVSILPDNWQTIVALNGQLNLSSRYYNADTWCKSNLQKNKWKWIRRSNIVSDNGSLNPFRMLRTKFSKPTIIKFKNPEDALMFKLTLNSEYNYAL